MIIGGGRVGTIGPGFRGTVDVVVDPIVLTQPDGTQTVGPPGELIVGTAPKADFPWGWLLLAGLGGLALGYLLLEEWRGPRGAQVPLA